MSAISALARYRKESARYLLQLCRFKKTLNCEEWSESVRRMEGGGRYRLSFAPYQREMMRTPFDPNVQMTVFMMPSRSGKTEVIMNIIGHAIDESKRKILVTYPTIGAAEKWSKETFMTGLIRCTESLDRVLGDGEGRRKSSNTILHKMFPGGLLNVFGANVPTEMRRAKGNLLIADEVDAFKNTDEGDPLKILWVRGTEYPDTVKIAASYPSLKGSSRIEDMMLQSDYRVMKYPCPHCSEWFVMHRNQIRYQRDAPEDAYMECPSNGCKITDAERRSLVLSHDKWTPTRPFTGIAGFHASGMTSPHPVQKGFKSHLHYVAQLEIDAEMAENREMAIQVLVNTFDAETYQAPEEEKPSPEGIAMEAYDFLSRAHDGALLIPDSCIMVTFGGDVQGDRVELEFVGHGIDNQTFGLGYHVLSGKPTENAVWNAVDKLVEGSVFRHPSGKDLKAVRGFIDSKYKTDFVRAFTRARKARGIFAIYGSTVLSKPIVSPAKKMAGVTVYEIGTHEAKSLIYQNANLRWDKKGDAPPGYPHYPFGFGYTPEYFKMLLCEDVEMKKGQDGNFYQFFSNPNRLRNEPLDVRGYAMAAARSLNPNYAKIAQNLAGNTPEKAVKDYQLDKTPRNFVTDA